VSASWAGSSMCTNPTTRTTPEPANVPICARKRESGLRRRG
jgi:hypothetical protein